VPAEGSKRLNHLVGKAHFELNYRSPSEKASVSSPGAHWLIISNLSSITDDFTLARLAIIAVSRAVITQGEHLPPPVAPYREAFLFVLILSSSWGEES